MAESTMQKKKGNENEYPCCYRVSLESMWGGGSEELEGTLRALRVLRARRNAEMEWDQVARFVVADPSLALQEEIIADDGMVVVREERPAHLRACVDIVTDRVAWNPLDQEAVRDDGVRTHCEV